MQNNSSPNIFQSGQIVCIESGIETLYGEVIQVIDRRQLCWVRPLTIAIETKKDSKSFDVNTDKEIIDLRSAADLLLPIALFRASYDTEAIFLLAELASREPSYNKGEMSYSLNSFVKQVWQNNKDKFVN